METLKMKKSIQIPAMVTAVLLFYLAQPYFFWSPFFSNMYLKIFIVAIVGFLFLHNKKGFSFIDKILLLFFFITLLLYTVTGGHNIFYFLACFPVIIIPFAKDSFLLNTYQFFLKIYCFISILSLLSWILAVTNIIGPYTTIPPLNPVKLGNYYVYPFLVSEIYPFVKFGCVFDEPGVVGTLSAIMLCINNLNMKKWTSWILLLTGLCSLSLFFYIIIIVYAIGFSLTISKKLGPSIFWIFILIIGIFAVMKVPALQENIGERLEWDADKASFSGDNRIDANLVDVYWSQMQGNSSLLWGVQNKSSFLEEAESYSSIWINIIVNGVVCVSLYVMFFLIYAIHKCRNIWSLLLFSGLFFGTIYQRPNMFNALYVFLFCCLASQSNSKAIK